MNIACRKNLESHGLGKNAEIWSPFMAKKSKNRSEDPLLRLVSAAERQVLAELILELAQEGPEVRRKCFEYLKKHVALPIDQQGEAEGEALMALWMELEADLSELEGPRIGLLRSSTYAFREITLLALLSVSS
jgi:hypothetical protein